MTEKRRPAKKDPVMNWFIEPNNAHTNQVIASNLLAISQLDESISLRDADDKEHSVFQVEQHIFITRLYKDRVKFNLDFNVFYRSGKNGPIRPWKMAGDKKKKINLKKV